MSITFEQFFQAIAQQESGGNYRAVGPQTRWGRAYGKYQVLETNIPSWTRQYFGTALTPQQFLNNATAQEAVARGVLKTYYKKYGPRGAASAWYSGNPNLHMSTRSQSGGPSIKEYVDSVMRRAGGMPADGGGGGASGGGGGRSELSESEVKPLARDELAEQYGFVESLLNSNKELKNLFNKAVKNQWTSAKFQAELRDTKWFKTTSKTEREYLIKRYGDPKTAKQEIDQAYVRVRQLANQLGVRENDVMRNRFKTWAYNVVAKGWSEAQLRYDIGKYVYFSDGIREGEGAEIQEELRSYAYDMGVTWKGDQYSDAARRIIRGIATVEEFKDASRRQAKSLYSFWSKEIDSGKTVADLAAPYMQSMAQILELPQGEANLFDPTIKKALQYKNPTTLQQEAKPLWMFETELRGDPRWKKTKNAQDSLMQVGRQVLSDFGFVY